MKAISPIPKISIAEGDKKIVTDLIELLSDLDDVIEVWNNLD